MALHKMSADYDLSPAALDVAVREFVKHFSHWPVAVIVSSQAGQADAKRHARELGLDCYCLPEPIAIDYDAWAVVDGRGNTVWSPGA